MKPFCKDLETTSITMSSFKQVSGFAEKKKKGIVLETSPLSTFLLIEYETALQKTVLL
jgi:hypothetical protein